MPSVMHLGRMRALPTPIVTVFVASAPEPARPGAGATPIAGAAGSVAAPFQLPSAEIDPALVAALPYRVTTAPGGLPVHAGDRVVAGLGIGGATPAICHEIAAGVLA